MVQAALRRHCPINALTTSFCNDQKKYLGTAWVYGYWRKRDMEQKACTFQQLLSSDNKA